MSIRPTQQTSYDSVRRALFQNYAKLVRAQEQVSTGLRILRPSDDPVGTATTLSLTRQIGDVGRYRTAIASARPSMDAGLAALDEAGNLYAEARELVMQGLNGTLNADDRRTIAQQVELLRERLIELGNAQLGERYLFGGTQGGAAPFVETQGPDGPRVVYRGDPNAREVEIGAGVAVGVNLAGDDVFARSDATGATWGALTGLAAGTTADEGSGFRYVTVRHDATALSAALATAGVASAGGAADDTLVGTRALVLDGAERTLRLGDGRVVHLPAAGDPGLADVTVSDEHGAVLHLDLSGWDGSSVTSTASGSASVSLDGTSFVAVDLTETDLELTDAADGTTLHLDTRGLARAGTELVSSPARSTRSTSSRASPTTCATCTTSTRRRCRRGSRRGSGSSTATSTRCSRRKERSERAARGSRRPRRALATSTSRCRARARTWRRPTSRT
jgi:flagellin-like hook-associated protein FlgL